MRLDLHGYTVHDAYKKFVEHISDCYASEIKETVIITGYGQIGDEIVAWTHHNAHIKHIARMDPNKGAYRVKIKQNTHNTSKTHNSQKTAETLDFSKLLKKYQKK